MKGKIYLDLYKNRMLVIILLTLTTFALAGGICVWKNPVKTDSLAKNVSENRQTAVNNEESKADEVANTITSAGSESNDGKVDSTENKESKESENVVSANNNTNSLPATQSNSNTSSNVTPNAQHQTQSQTSTTQTNQTPKVYSIGDAENYIESVLLALINAERSRVGVGQLAFSGQVAQAADIRVSEESDLSMTTQNHNRPDGRSFDTVFAEVGYSGYTSWGENLAYGYQSLPVLDRANLDAMANKMFTNWKNSPGHYANMIRSSFNQTGFGVNLVSQNGKLYYFGIELFARK